MVWVWLLPCCVVLSLGDVVVCGLRGVFGDCVEFIRIVFRFGVMLELVARYRGYFRCFVCFLVVLGFWVLGFGVNCGMFSNVCFTLFGVLVFFLIWSLVFGAVWV